MTKSKETLYNFILQKANMSNMIAQEVVDHFTEVELNKNDFILQQGRICDFYIFLNEGFARAYTFDVDGNEVTTGFFQSSAVVFDVASFFKQIPSQENIQTLSDCTGLKITFQDMNQLFHSVPQFREFGRLMLVNGFTSLKERTLSMITKTAEQRYQHFIETHAEVFQHASLKSIASYLGITDTSLSRIRKEISKK
jgi:CRP-like cAMP-binding protein